uniref:UmuC domain-containing protein n=1 Tax=Streptomyces sp. NBC_01393 TaxID=2903851 RepID=A0AAU3I9S9_9ACTN
MRQRALPKTGAVLYFQRDARGLSELIQLRALAHFGVSSAVGAAPNRMLAAMACALTGPGWRLVIEDSPEVVSGFLQPRPVRELPGVGARAAATLSDYGLHTVGDVADLPELTLQRLLGARPGRTLYERAHGYDTTIVDPTPTPASMSSEHRFDRDELDPARHRRALLALADDLGARLRASGQIAAGVTCTVHYADASSTRRSRTLPEPNQHTVLLARTAYALYDSLGLQRARVRSIALRADVLRPDERASRQLTLDSSDDKPLAIEAVADRARARAWYGHNVLYPVVSPSPRCTEPPPRRCRGFP